jgi:hypothetical protein
MKTLIHVALLASLAAPLAWSAGTVKVYTPDSKTQNLNQRRASARSRRTAKAGQQLVAGGGDQRAAGNGAGGTTTSALLAG